MDNFIEMFKMVVALKSYVVFGLSKAQIKLNMLQIRSERVRSWANLKVFIPHH